MKMLKIIGLIVVILIALPFVIAAFVKNEYVVERHIMVERPKEQVFDYIKHLKNQEQYSVWVMMDPNLKKEFRGTDGTEGFVFAWSGNKQAGKGEQEIKQIEEGSKMEVELRFEEPMKSVASAPFTTQALSPTQTKVTWGMQGTSKYPMNFMNLFMEKMVGGPIETSLVNLKTILEKQ